MLVTPDTFDQSLNLLTQCDILTCDTETNYTDFQADRHIIGIAIGGVTEEGWKSFYFPFRHRNEMMMREGDDNLPEELIFPVLGLIQSKKTIWHNWKFDAEQLQQEGLVVEECVTYDTLLLSHYEDENKPSHELFMLGPLVGEKKLGTEIDDIAVSLGGGGKNKVQKHQAKKRGWDKIPPSVMGIYAEEDILITWKLFKKFLPQIQFEYKTYDTHITFEEIYEREVKLNNAIRKMEARGVGSDRKALETQVELTEHEIQEIESDLGFEPSKPAQLAHTLFALPPEGLGFRPSGFSKIKSVEFGLQPLMDEDRLARYDHPTVEKVLRYRSLAKANNTYYRGWLDRLEADSRIRASFKQHGTKTTRWSCSGPNFQNLPRDWEKMPVKKFLRARPGYVLYSFDYSQIEFRLGVIYVGSEFFRNGFLNGIDVHKITAQNIGAYDQFPDDPDTARYVGKQANFLVINRGGPKVLKKQLWHNARLDLTESKCKKYLDDWHEANPEWKPYARQAEIAARERGWLKLWNGRILHFDDFRASAAFNSLCQGGAGQIMNDSIIMLDEAGYELVAQVHDDIWIEIPEDEVEVQVPKIKEIMEWPTKEFEFPFEVDAKLLARAA